MHVSLYLNFFLLIFIILKCKIFFRCPNEKYYEPSANLCRKKFNFTSIFLNLIILLYLYNLKNSLLIKVQENGSNIFLLINFILILEDIDLINQKLNFLFFSFGSGSKINVVMMIFFYLKIEL